jgi:carboxyl-terminal processing protease
MRRRLLPLLLALLVPAALLFGLWAGGHPRVLPSFIRDAFVGDEEAQVYQEVLDRIDADFYRKVDKDEIAGKTLAAAVDALNDPFSRYIDPETKAEFDASTSGRFEGVGMNVQEVPRGLKILEVFAGGPAAEAGLGAGDLIVAVNGRSLKGSSSEDSTTEIKGPAGTMVELTIVSGGKRRDINVKRAAISVPVSEKRMVRADGEKVGYVSLSQFTAGAHGYVLKNVRDLLDAGAQGIVLDLRHNGGGLLEEGVLTASVFIPDGLIVSTRGRNRPTRRFNAAGESIDTDIPVADRDRRPAGPRPRDGRRHADLRQGRLPGDRGPPQRRRPRHHRGGVLHPGRTQPRPARGQARAHSRCAGGGRPRHKARRGARQGARRHCGQRLSPS